MCERRPDRFGLPSVLRCRRSLIGLDLLLRPAAVAGDPARRLASGRRRWCLVLDQLLLQLLRLLLELLLLHFLRLLVELLLPSRSCWICFSIPAAAYKTNVSLWRIASGVEAAAVAHGSRHLDASRARDRCRRLDRLRIDSGCTLTTGYFRQFVGLVIGRFGRLEVVHINISSEHRHTDTQPRVCNVRTYRKFTMRTPCRLAGRAAIHRRPPEPEPAPAASARAAFAAPATRRAPVQASPAGRPHQVATRASYPVRMAPGPHPVEVTLS